MANLLNRFLCTYATNKNIDNFYHFLIRHIQVSSSPDPELLSRLIQLENSVTEKVTLVDLSGVSLILKNMISGPHLINVSIFVKKKIISDEVLQVFLEISSYYSAQFTKSAQLCCQKLVLFEQNKYSYNSLLVISEDEILTINDFSNLN